MEWIRARLAVPLLLLLAAVLQLTLFVQWPSEGSPWFLYGRDTITHDAVVHLWMQQCFAAQPFTLPLWMPELQGGLPVVGAFLFTPLAPAVWPLWPFVYPTAQWLGWLIALWTGGCGAYLLGRSFGLARLPALGSGLAWMLCGHVVTLIHAGHFQKVVALGWLPWLVAGAVMLLRGQDSSGKAMLIGVLGLGMMLLGGHPQIAYLGILIVVFAAIGRIAVDAISRQSCMHKVIGILVLLGLGLGLGAAQLLPGVEMAGWSNRASGLGYEEAVATSYPTGEIMEYLVPRWKGSSVAGDVYTGGWGERIVSDYFGLGFLLLAFLGVFSKRRKFMLFTFLNGLFFLLVGLGLNFPLYRLLFDYLPGFASFRSPGTFMAGTSLSLAVLVGLGCELLLGFRIFSGWKPGRLPLIMTVLLALSAGEVARANRHFLIGFSWERFNAEFVSPNEMDLFFGADSGRDQLVHDAGSEMSLRPILFGRRVLHGYHPISFGVKLKEDAELNYQSADWLDRQGFQWVLVRGLPPDFKAEGRVEKFPAQGRIAVERNSPSYIRGAGVETWQWLRRTPNMQVLAINGNGGEVTFQRIIAPGFDILLNGRWQGSATEPSTHFTTTVPAGESVIQWIYRPWSWRLGLFMSAVSLALMTGLFRRFGRW